MPKRTDISKILIIGSGPVIIGQGCEFDYSGLQACRALRQEGYQIVVVNSNPATIMSDPDLADSTYIEPLTRESVSKIIDKERPDALLPTLGGQMALNLGILLESEGVLEKYGCELIGISKAAMELSGSRAVFAETMRGIGAGVALGKAAGSIEEGVRMVKEIGFPAILKPSRATGGAGSAIAYNMEEFVRMLAFALDSSPVHEVMIEQSVLGCKEVEFEVVRDSADNVVVVAGMENIDPIGVHAGDSVVVAPIQTLATHDINRLTDIARNAARAVELVGAMSIQFGVNTETGDAVVTEINPRFTRASALASKATGYPIARTTAKLAVGMRLDEIGNEITGSTSLDFEPAMDYCVVKIPRFAFDEFPQADPALNTSMKAVGEAMAIGRSFKEALQKGMRSLEIGRFGLGSDGKDLSEKARRDLDVVRDGLARPNAERLFFVRYAIEDGMSSQDIHDLSGIDPWFIENIRELVEFEKKLEGRSLVSVPADLLTEAKQLGYSDTQLACLLETDEEQVRMRRKVLGIAGTFHAVDTCAGQFEARRPYFYATYEASDESRVSDSPKKVIVLGGGPNRIGQGAELDYCCVQALQTIGEEGGESIAVNCNPAALSTDFASSDRLYVAPLMQEDVLGIVAREKPMGVIVQFGGHAAANLAASLKRAGVSVLGTSADALQKVRDRRFLAQAIHDLGLRQTQSTVAFSIDDGLREAGKIGYPVLAKRGRTKELAYDETDLTAFMASAIQATPGQPVLIEEFLEDAIEVDVDAISDGETTLVCGVMEHIEQAGVHSGDSACSLPPYSLAPEIVDEIKRQSRLLASELQARGLINVLFAVKAGQVYIIEVSARASRTVPFVSKATGVPWAKVATRIMLGKSLKDQGVTEVTPKHVCVKEAVFPFVRFPGVDVVLGPEMKSTGEVMGIDLDFGHAFIKAEIAAGQYLPNKGTAFVSISDKDKRDIGEIGQKLKELGFEILATRGTARTLREAGVDSKVISKIGEGRPDATDFIKNDEIDLVINTPSGKKARRHEISIRSTVVARGIPIITTIAGAKATLFGMQAVREQGETVRSLQEYGAEGGPE